MEKNSNVKMVARFLDSLASSSSSGSLSERLAAADKEMEIHTHVTSYINLDFIVPTSNCVERLFSQGKRVFRHSRQSLLPYNFEAIMFLKANRGLWDIDVVCDALVPFGPKCLR